MDYLCSEFVLPLASGSTDGLGPRRWADQAHLNVLADLLQLGFMVHSVRTQLWSTTVGDQASSQGSLFHLVYDGSHYELLHM